MTSFLRELIRQPKNSTCCRQVCHTGACTSTGAMWQSKNRNIKMIDLDQTSCCETLWWTLQRSNFQISFVGILFLLNAYALRFPAEVCFPPLCHLLYSSVDLQNIRYSRNLRLEIVVEFLPCSHLVQTLKQALVFGWLSSLQRGHQYLSSQRCPQDVLWPGCIGEFGDVSGAPEVWSSFISAQQYAKHSKAARAFLVDLAKMYY